MCVCVGVLGAGRCVTTNKKMGREFERQQIGYKDQCGEDRKKEDDVITL